MCSLQRIAGLAIPHVLAQKKRLPLDRPTLTAKIVTSGVQEIERIEACPRHARAA
jgi:hypothetical protein